MPVKDVYGKEVSRETHMKFAYNPTSALLNELKKKNMSDREIMEAKGLGSKKSIHNPKLYNKTNDYHWPTKSKSTIKYPDARKHQFISFIKSTIRIIGYGLLVVNVPAAVGVLILSEAVGVIEELV